MDNGVVILVGAGCGKGLITVKGLAALRAADVIVYDDLTDFDLLHAAKADAQRIYVGKRYGQHSEKQENIQQILIEEARAGKTVVRLKGGDSFVFGRGGEEILALQKAHIPYAVIPGVSSAVAVPENLGIPVTHRGVAQSFTVVTGHTATEAEEDYGALAALHGTLVFLMGLHNLETICRKLMENGKSKDTPAAVLSKGFDRQQQRIDGTLETIAQKAASAQTPAVLAVGDTVAFDFRKTVHLPLETVSVTVTGTKAFTARLSAKLTALGAYVTESPLLQIVAQTDPLPETFDAYTYLVFTSANGVNVFFDCLQGRKTDYRAISHLKFACIGDACAAALAKYGFYADFIPCEFTAAALGKELPAVLNREDRLLLVRAKNGAEELPAALQNAKIKFDDIKIYDTQVTACPTDCDTDYIAFASASGVDAFFENGGQLHGAKPVCIGESTARALKKYSDVIPLVAKIHTAEGILSAISEDIQ